MRFLLRLLPAGRQLAWHLLPVWMLLLLLDVMSPWGSIDMRMSAILVFWLACQKPTRSILPFLLVGVLFDWLLTRQLGDMAFTYSMLFLSGALSGRFGFEKHHWLSFCCGYGAMLLAQELIKNHHILNINDLLINFVWHAFCAWCFDRIYTMQKRAKPNLYPKRAQKR